MKRPLASFLLLLAWLPSCAGAPRDALTVVPGAADWRLLAADAPAFDPGPPPAPGSAAEAADHAAVRGWRRPRTPAEAQAIARWGDADPVVAWAEEAGALAGSYDLAEPARAARALAHVQAACHDALVATWAAKRRYARPGPAHLFPEAPPEAGLPSYPSEAAAVAEAAATVLGGLFPQAACGLATRARAVAEVAVATGRAFPSDVAAGRATGAWAARAALARLAADEAATPGPTAWRDPWPLSPEAGAWRPWTFEAAAALAPPPPGPVTPAERAAARARNRGMTIRMRAVAVKWLEADQARLWHARATALAARAPFAAPERARVLAYTDVALADAAIAAWAAQYALARPRPASLDAAIEPVLVTPAHPGHPDDVAAMATAAATYLAQAFPAEAPALAREAAEAADAALFAGWGFDADRAAGVRLGEAVGANVLARAKEDGRP